MVKVKKWLPLVIIVVGTIGILSYNFHEALFTDTETPILSALVLFKYFTILTNLVAIIYFWLLYSLRLHLKYKWFDHFIGAVVIYLTITFVIYVVLLAPTYKPEGLQIIGSLCLHYLNPILVIGYYAFWYNDFHFEDEDVYYWMVFPIMYIVFLIGHGLITDDYLYPFFQVSTNGVDGLMAMIGILLVIFLSLSFILVKIVSKRE